MEVTSRTESPFSEGWRRFRQNTGALVGGGCLVVLVLVAGVPRALLPDPSPTANRQFPELARSKPGAVAWMLFIESVSPGASSNSTARSIAILRDTASLRTWEDTLFWVAKTGETHWIRIPEVVCALDGNHPLTLHFLHRYRKPYRFERDTVHWIAPGGVLHSMYLPLLIQKLRREQVRQIRFPLGCDVAGRDLLSRLVLGARISLGVGSLAVVISLALGVSIGGLAGYLGGWLDSLAQWLMTILWSLPSLLLAIALAFVLGRGFATLCLAIGLSVWVDVARVVRGEVLSLKSRTYIEAARVLGIPPLRILWGHLLPGLAGPIAILAAANFATAVLLEAGLSFLGLGVAPPTPSWGGMLQDHYRYVLVEGSAWLAIVPGTALVLLIVSLNLIGQGLRDAFDPKSGSPGSAR